MRPNRLLHDDGTTLSTITLSGKRTPIWRHPRIRATYLAASPDGKRLAISVGFEPRNERQLSFVLYLLDEDGSVRTVDAVRNFQSIDDPLFLRAPTDFEGPIRLYWLRSSEDINPSTGRLEAQPMVLTDHGPQPVEVPLRYGEGPFAIHGYPGAATFTVTLFYHNNVPTRLHVLTNVDYAQGSDASVTLWGEFEFRAQTDVFVGVAWVSPIDYVIPVAQEYHKDKYQLRLFRVGCESYGSHVVYEGRGIDWGYAEVPWRILPAGPGRVLVLGARDVSRVFQGRAKEAAWLAVDLGDGTITRTRVKWRPREGWTWVSPSRKVNPRNTGDCSGFKWIWP